MDDPFNYKDKDYGDLISDTEGEFLTELAKFVPPDGIIVNIGTWHGKSVACFAVGKPTAHIYTIDLDHSRDLSKLPDVTYITGDSGDVALDWDKPIDLLFVDGSHSYSGVMRDMEFARHVKVGGKIVFHDYDAFKHECTYAIDDWWADHRPQYRKIAAQEYLIVYEKKSP